MREQIKSFRAVNKELNKENFQAVLDRIKANPCSWDQSKWHCGTTHCFAGHAQIMAGKPIDDATVRRDARMYLGLKQCDASVLFRSDATIEDFEEFLRTEGYDEQGFDCAGYNREGYGIQGFHRDGYDTDGLDINNKPRPE